MRSSARQRSSLGWWSAPPLILIALFFYYPLSRILALGFGWSEPVSFGFPHWLAISWFTLWQAVASALLAVLVGLVFAYLLYRKTVPGAGVWRALTLVPFVMPILVIAIGIHTFQIGNVLPGVFWILTAHVLIDAPLTINLVGTFWASQDHQVEEAAAIDGAGRMRTFLAVTVPMLRPALVSAFTLTLIFCASSFGAILLLGDTGTGTLETAIYRVSSAYLDLRGASILAVTQLALVAAAAAAARLLGASGRVTSVETTDRTARVDRRDWPVVAMGVMLAALAVAPFLRVLWLSVSTPTGVSLSNFDALGSTGARQLLNLSVLEAIDNSLRNGLLVAVLAVTLGTLTGYLIARLRAGAFKYILNLAYILPLGVSSVVIGFGYLIGFDAPPFEFRASWLVVPLAQAVIALPLVVTMTGNALSGIDPELLDATATDGASRWQQFRYLEFPLIAPTIGVAASFAAVIAIGDFGASSFLAYGDQETLPQVLFRLISRPGPQNFGMAMAAAALLMIVSAAPLALAGIATLRKRSDR